MDGSLLRAQGAQAHRHCQPPGGHPPVPLLQPAAQGPLLCTFHPSIFSTSGPVSSVGTGTYSVVGGILGKQVAFAGAHCLPTSPTQGLPHSVQRLQGWGFLSHGLVCSVWLPRVFITPGPGSKAEQGPGVLLVLCLNLHHRGRDTCLQGCGSGSEERAVWGLGLTGLFSSSAHLMSLIG